MDNGADDAAYAAANRLSDRLVALYFAVAIASMAVAAGIAWALSLPPPLTFVPIVGGSLAIFFRWSAKQAATMPADRPPTPVRWRWVLMWLAAFVVLVSAIAVISAAVA